MYDLDSDIPVWLRKNVCECLLHDIDVEDVHITNKWAKLA